MSAYPVVPRVLRTEFLERVWAHEDARRHAEDTRNTIGAALVDRSVPKLVPFTGQSAGLVKDVLPAGEIVNRLVDETRVAAEQLLAAAAP